MTQTLLTTQTFLACYNESHEAAIQLLQEASEEALQGFSKQLTLEGLISILKAREIKGGLTIEQSIELRDKGSKSEPLTQEETVSLHDEQLLSAAVFALLETVPVTELIQNYEEMKQVYEACPRLAFVWIKQNPNKLIGFITTKEQWEEWPAFLRTNFVLFLCNDLQNIKNIKEDWVLDHIFCHHAGEVLALLRTGENFLNWVCDQPQKAWKFAFVSKAHKGLAKLLTGEECVRLAKTKEGKRILTLLILNVPQTIASRINTPQQFKELPDTEALMLIQSASDRIFEVCDTIEALLSQNSDFLRRLITASPDKFFLKFNTAENFTKLCQKDRWIAQHLFSKKEAEVAHLFENAQAPLDAISVYNKKTHYEPTTPAALYYAVALTVLGLVIAGIFVGSVGLMIVGIVGGLLLYGCCTPPQTESLVELKI